MSDSRLTGTWVRRTGTEPTHHECAGPYAEHVGDLWRCGCGRLWRWARACDLCDTVGHGNPSGGQCTVGRMWRPATLGQRIRHWRRR